MKFNYRDKVKIKRGFFKGQERRVLDFKVVEHRDPENHNRISYTYEYALEINGITHNWIDEDDLQLIERSAA